MIQKGVTEIYQQYWRAYGGRKALLRSSYLHGALLMLALTGPFWIGQDWWEQVISVIPSLLGFTLGGFAMFLGFGDEKFRALLAEPDEDDPEAPSLFVGLCATFVHFILIQCLALGVAVLAKAWSFYFPWIAPFDIVVRCLSFVGSAVGYGLFLYAIASMLAATMYVFRVATWYEGHRREQIQHEADNASIKPGARSGHCACNRDRD